MSDLTLCLFGGGVVSFWVLSVKVKYFLLSFPTAEDGVLVPARGSVAGGAVGPATCVAPDDFERCRLSRRPLPMPPESRGRCLRSSTRETGFDGSKIRWVLLLRRPGRLGSTRYSD